MKTFSYLLYGVFILLLSGCGAITASLVDVPKRYEDSAATDKARLRVIYDMFDHIYLSPNGFCSKEPDPQGGRLISKPVGKSGLNIISGNSVTFQEKLLGMPQPPFELENNLSRVYSEFFIPANRNVIISYASQARGPGGRYCPQKAFVFNPSPNKDYETEIVLAGATCHYKMQEIVNNEKILVLENFSPVISIDCSGANKAAK